MMYISIRSQICITHYGYEYLASSKACTDEIIPSPADKDNATDNLITITEHTEYFEKDLKWDFM